MPLSWDLRVFNQIRLSVCKLQLFSLPKYRKSTELYLQGEDNGKQVKLTRESKIGHQICTRKWLQIVSRLCIWICLTDKRPKAKDLMGNLSQSQ